MGGRSVAGLMVRPPDMPAEVPDNWQIYFGSADIDADLAKANEPGATVLVPPTAIPNMGRFSVLMGPQGATFAIFQG